MAIHPKANRVKLAVLASMASAFAPIDTDRNENHTARSDNCKTTKDRSKVKRARKQRRMS